MAILLHIHLIKKFNQNENNISHSMIIPSLTAPSPEIAVENQMNKLQQNLNILNDDIDFDDYKFQDLVTIDKRSFWKLIWDYGKKGVGPLVILGDKAYESYSLNLLIYIYGLEVDFFASAFFFTDDLIMDYYDNDSFCLFILKGIKTFLFTSFCLSFLSVFSYPTLQISNNNNKKLKESERNKQIKIIINSRYFRLKCVCIGIILCNICFIYYILIFNSLFFNLQNKWLVDSVIGYGESVGLSFGKVILFSVLRKLSFALQNHFAFDLPSKILFVISIIFLRYLVFL